MCAAAAPSRPAKKILLMGGTRFIGQYLARQLVEEGHDVTLFTRGKKPIAARIPDDSDAGFEKYKVAPRECARFPPVLGGRYPFHSILGMVAMPVPS